MLGSTYITGQYAEDGTDQTLDSHVPDAGQAWYVGEMLVGKTDSGGSSNTGVAVVLVDDASGNDLYRVEQKVNNNTQSRGTAGLYYYDGVTLEVREVDPNDGGNLAYQVGARRLF